MVSDPEPIVASEAGQTIKSTPGFSNPLLQMMDERITSRTDSIADSGPSNQGCLSGHTVSSNPLLQMMEQSMAARTGYTTASGPSNQGCPPGHSISSNPLLQMMEQRMVARTAASGPSKQGCSSGPTVSSDPLLQMMEQRMTAREDFLQGSAPHEQYLTTHTVPNNSLLRMSEQRMPAQTTFPILEQKVTNYNPLLQMSEHRSAISTTSTIPCVVHDSPHSQQLQRLKEMMASRISQREAVQMQNNDMTQNNIPQRNNTRTDSEVLPRCTHSLSELERLRRENILIQFRKQVHQEKNHQVHRNDSHTTLSGKTTLSSFKRSTSSSSSSSTLGKRASDDDGGSISYGSANSLFSLSRKMHRHSNSDIRTLLESKNNSSSGILDEKIRQLSLNTKVSQTRKCISPEKAKVKPKKINLISSLLAQQSSTDNVVSYPKQFCHMNMTSIVSAVPDRMKYQNINTETKPIDIVKEALSSRGLECNIKPSKHMEEGFFVRTTEMYGHEIVGAVRANDTECLRKLHADGINLQCGNQFGETLIHLACRRSHKDLVTFLVEEAGVSLRVKDDYGRTPMHDVCWRANPDLDLLDILLERAPELLMLSDDRGHTPLDYSRREHWEVLVPFLLERTHKFRPVG